MSFRKLGLVLTGCFFVATLFADSLYQKTQPPETLSDFDHYLSALWQQNNITPANEASDTVMVRRLYIDLVGRTPTPDETRTYLQSTDKNKQRLCVETLLNSEEHALFWTMRFGDELRIKSEFPINLWPDAAFLYSRTLFDFLKQNEPYNDFAQRLLLSQGSNFRNGGVNFFRAVSVKDATHLADATTVFFMGRPLTSYTAIEQQAWTNAFNTIRYKPTHEWKEEIVYSTLTGAADPRHDGYDKLIASNATDFAHTAVARFWRWIFGDQAVQPEILDFLTASFQQHHFDVRALTAEICTSVAYKVSCLPTGEYPKMVTFAAVYPTRRMDAEVLADAIAQITASPYSYTSVIPEPFSFYHCRASALPDGSVTSPFLILFGRPSRDTGAPQERKHAITAKQRLYLYNSSDLYRKLQLLCGTQLQASPDKLESLYMLFYSRPPTDHEREIFRTLSRKQGKNVAIRSLAWILMNSKEFLYQH